MAMRQMRSTFEDVLLYESSFNTETGSLIRAVNISDDPYNHENVFADQDQLRRFKSANQVGDNEYNYRRLIGRSPYPETIDIKITNQCGFGCAYCYMDSVPDGQHMDATLIETLLDGFDEPPYQVALGGGEPTLHPDFVSILKSCRDRGVVPNYTTAGMRLSADIADATNEHCGGVALTYHAFKGIDWFTKKYAKWSEALDPSVQLNVHVIAGKDVAKNLFELIGHIGRPGIGRPLSIVLLAYYAVGRGSLSGIMTKDVYENQLPGAIVELQNLAKVHGDERGARITYSEGMLPYFLSRPELGVDSTFAMAAEGRFSCYMDNNGFMSDSSFNDPDGYDRMNVLNETPQDIWQLGMGRWFTSPSGSPCYNCKLSSICAAPDKTHMNACSYMDWNSKAGAQPRKRNRGW